MPVTGVPDQGAGQRGVERMLSPLLENNVQTEKKEAYIATDQAERSIILKGTHIGKDTCLYFYAEKADISMKWIRNRQRKRYFAWLKKCRL